jgi:alcohol dehydrogenase
MNEFSFSVPQNIIVGKGSLKKLPELSAKIGKKHAFIISGPSLERMGVVGKCVNELEKGGISADIFTKTEGNPSVETVDAATKAFKESGADYIIALGGGSPMDVAKAVGVLAEYGGSIVDYEGADKVPGDIVPIIAIPTTAGTGSEVTAFSVITDHSRNYKLTVFSYKLYPVYAILDAELITSVPAKVAAACGIDAMVHALESYISKAASPFSDALGLKALELIGSSIRAYVADRTNLEAAEKMLTGSMFAGIAFSWARLGNVHAMSHPVSAYYNVAHGVANAVILPAVVEYNSICDNGKYYDIYKNISEVPVSKEEFSPAMLTETIVSLNKELGIPAKLSEVGVTTDKIEEMTTDAMKSGNIAVNPRTTQREDIVELYRRVI